MKLTRLFAAAAAVCLFFAAMPSQAVDLQREEDYADCRGYVLAPSSVASTTARAAIIASSSFLHPNRHRAQFGPHYYTRFYDPIRACAILRTRARKNKARKRR